VEEGAFLLLQLQERQRLPQLPQLQEQLSSQLQMEVDRILGIQDGDLEVLLEVRKPSSVDQVEVVAEDGDRQTTERGRNHKEKKLEDGEAFLFPHMERLE